MLLQVSLPRLCRTLLLSILDFSYLFQRRVNPPTYQKIAPLCLVTNTAACSFVQDEYEDLEYIVFDELSMMNGTQIGNISDRLREVKHPYRGELCSYFGGYNVVFMGDFDQLPPVTGSALYKDLLRIENIKDTPTKSKMTNALSPDHPRYQGLRAFFAADLALSDNKQKIKRRSCTRGSA